MKIFGVKIDQVTKKEALSLLNESKIIFTPNPEILLKARIDTKFREALAQGDLMLADGHGILFVSTLLQYKSKFFRALIYLPALILFLFYKKPFKKVFPEVIHGSDFMADSIAWAEKNSYSVFFLGAKPGVAQKTSVFFKKKHPNLKVAGASSLNPGQEAFLELKKSAAQLVLVAYGAPKQERWIAQYAKQLPELKAIIGIGGSFDFYAGELKRAPLGLQKLGLEWMWRLFLQPKQRLVRIFNALVKFPIRSLFLNSKH